MIIKSVSLFNFKPYFGKVDINLSVEDKKNIILIGGKNGQGKTSFLVGLVWCLYGDKLSDVDEIYNKEIKNNYNYFLSKSMNRIAQLSNENEYYVEIVFHTDDYKTITTRRTYNIFTSIEEFEILIDGKESDFDDDEKVEFVEEYLIPIQAAKFVFFDAEKISEIADMDLKKQGSFMNDALNKILGLDTYENLKNDLIIYERNLRIQSANENETEQLKLFQEQIDIDKIKIENIKKDFTNIEEAIVLIKSEIAEIDEFLLNQNVSPQNINIYDLKKEKDILLNRKSELNLKIIEIIEMIPYAMAGHQLQQVVRQVKEEQDAESGSNIKHLLKELGVEFIEALFNQAPFPDGGDISLDKKIFYYNKAKALFSTLGTEQDEIVLPFFHDIQKNEVDFLQNLLSAVSAYGNDLLKTIFTETILIDNKINELDIKICRIEGNAEDSLFLEYKERKKSKEIEKERMLIDKIKSENEVNLIENGILKKESHLSNLLSKIAIASDKKKKISKLNDYIKTVNEFISFIKESKCENLSKTILNFLKLVMHKALIDKVQITILPDDKGLMMKLISSLDQEIHQNMLSKGEQQILVSCILKGIFSESIRKFPVFIDTPLARLDISHKENLINHYYPNISEQVVIFSTDDEITYSRSKMIESYIMKKYIITNSHDKSVITEGYF